MQAIKIATLKEIIKNLDPNITMAVASSDEDIKDLQIGDECCFLLVSFRDLTQKEKK